MNAKNVKGFLIGVFTVASTLSVLAAVNIPHVFKPGDLITASDMNENFSSLKAGIDAVETSASAKQTRVSGVCAAGSSIREVKADGTVTCQTDNVGTGGGASYTAGSGLTLAANQFSVDATKTQSRVSGICAAGSAIKEVKPDGQVICEAVGSTGGGVAGVSSVNGKTAGVTLEAGSANLTIDNSQTGKVVFNVANSSYTAGTGLALAGNAFSVDPASVQSRVSGTCPSGKFLQSVNQDGTVNCNDALYIGGGVYGDSGDGSGFSIINTGVRTGLFSSTNGANGAAAIKGAAISTTGLTLGVYGDAENSPVGTGVVGKGGVTGGYFEATGVPAQGYTPTGIYGVAGAQGVGVKAASSGTALEVDGPIKVSGSKPSAFYVDNSARDIVVSFDAPVSNNDPNAIVFVSQIGAYNAVSSVSYDPISGKWFIDCFKVTGTTAAQQCAKGYYVLVIKR